MTTGSNDKVIGMFGFLVKNLDVFRELFEASVEINLFELPRENTKDTVKQEDNCFIHQYALANQATESRMHEIIRDMLAIHADYYLISKDAPHHDEVEQCLSHYGYKVIVL